MNFELRRIFDRMVNNLRRVIQSQDTAHKHIHGATYHKSFRHAYEDLRTWCSENGHPEERYARYFAKVIDRALEVGINLQEEHVI